MIMKKQDVINDVKAVALKLERTPTYAEYFSLGMASEYRIKQIDIGGYPGLCRLAGLKSPQRLSINSEPGFQIAQLKSEVQSLEKYVKELESEAVDAKSLRQLIGSPESTTALGEDSHWMRTPRKRASLTGTPTLFISDIHFDEVVKAPQVNYANEYNHDIAVERIKHTFRTALDLTTKYLSKPKYDGFVCSLGGDLLSGNIHEELKETNDARINESILSLTDLLIEGVGTLADEFGKVFVPCVVGNHGRHDRKPRFKNKVKDNYEWLVYQYLARHFKNDSRISFLIPDGPDAYYEVYGKKYCLSHGDQFQGGTGIAGIFSPLMLGMARKQRRQTSMGKAFHTMLIGHFHSLIMTDNLVVNGSIKGLDEFVYNLNLPFEPPQQALFIDHPEKRMTFRMPILCDSDAKKNRI